ncbi:unnamed protein product [Vitrella brassicaformis CCMP3155]|uniref:Uncharacterized protein n=1 Tax=Vitrella brassicaformis (strain CCMP3155) TaxID=1169540 RepID=A0A0G4EJL9_VITBC|nr:unnamed protein product [Vitrella brassicaformis CCMP3155]|eukprot:CEL96703.1 unnamed protein product [Vitrella brassicaformis CCMP3155]
MDGPPAKRPRTAPPAQSHDSSNSSAPKTLTSLLDGLIWLNVSSYESVNERLAMSCVCRAFYWAIYSLIRVINWHRPNHDLSCTGPNGSLVTFEQQQHAVILLPKEEEVEEIGRARLFAFVSLQLVHHTDTLKAIQTTQAKNQRDGHGDADGGEASEEDAASDLPVAQVKGPDAVFPSVTSVEVDSLDGLHLFQQQKLVCPALERLTGKVVSAGECITGKVVSAGECITADWPPSVAAKRAAFDGSLAFILGSSRSLSHLDIYPLLCCYEGEAESSVPLTTAALSSLKNLRHVGHLKLGGSDRETSKLVTLLRQLTPRGGTAASSSSACDAPSPSFPPSPSGASTKRQLKIHCPLDIVRDPFDRPYMSGDSVGTIQAAEQMGWGVVRQGGVTRIECGDESTEGPPTAETLTWVETVKRHAGGGDTVSLTTNYGQSDSTSLHFSGIRLNNARRLEVELAKDNQDVDAGSLNGIPQWLTEEGTLKSLCNVTELYLTDDGLKHEPTCDPEYLIPPPTPNRLSRLLSSLPALTHVYLGWPAVDKLWTHTVSGIVASEALAYIQQGIKPKPLKKLEMAYDEPLSLTRAAPVAFPSPQTTRQYPKVQELAIEIRPIDTEFFVDENFQNIYNARAESVLERLRDLFRLVHELRPKHATFKLTERADIFAAPEAAALVESELILLFIQGRVRNDMAEYGMEVTRPTYARFDGEDSSIEELVVRPAEHELTVEMVMRPWEGRRWSWCGGARGTEGMGGLEGLRRWSW